MTIINKSQSDVIIFDDLAPEAAAMVLAMYSRDPRSVRVHLEQVARVGPAKFMGQYYVGYGHRSIGDCGSTTICVENVSMLVAKAVQQNPLYNGQEASTRYLDMTAQAVLNPLGTETGEKIQQRWMSLYVHLLTNLVPYLKQKYPMLETDDPRQYEKAIRARAFDISRSFLPAGCTTYVGWHTNLRQAWDHLRELSFHPLLEVRELAERMFAGLRQKYPSSFNFGSYQEQDEYLKECARSTYADLCREPSFWWSTHTLNTGLLGRSATATKVLSTRPPRTELPDWFNRYGQIQFRFLLDFGSFRDLQRHRSCTQLMPLLTTRHEFNAWYLDSLPKELRTLAVETLGIQEAEIEKVEDPLVRQYYIAMGYNVACEVTAGLPSAVYIAELRSGQAVHPTLRPIAQNMGRVLRQILPEMSLHCDMSPDEWSTIRGKHDIVRK